MKVLMVMAHPDDEILFGYPIFQYKDIEKKVLICSSDFYNEERTWCKYRKEALFEICNDMDVEVECLDYPSSFYKTQSRPPKDLPKNTEESDSQAPLRKMCQDIVDRMLELEKDYDYVFTHNPYGEYGHFDHRLLFDLVLKNTTKPVLITDIMIKSNWGFNTTISDNMKKVYYNNIFKENCILDKDLFNYCKNKYISKNGWTWSGSISESCNLFLI